MSIDYSNKSNNEILMEIKNLQVEFDSVKQRMLKDYDRLEEIEKLFNSANNEIAIRMKGNK